MIKKLLLILSILLFSTACGQSVEELNNEGNEAFAEENYNQALETYRLAQSENPDIPEPYYNAANTYYRQKDYERAELQVQQALRDAYETLAQNSFYNLGNIYFEDGNFEGAVEAYKEALRFNPDDREAKHNLELALQQRQAQQNQQNEQNQDNQDNPENQENQEDEQNQQSEENEENEEGQQNQQQQQDNQEEEDQQNQSGQEGEESQSEAEQNQADDAEEQPESEAREESQSQSGEAGEENDDPADSAQTSQVQVEPLTPDQARQLLQSIAESSSTLQEHLFNLRKQSPGTGDSIQDW